MSRKELHARRRSLQTDSPDFSMHDAHDFRDVSRSILLRRSHDQSIARPRAPSSSSYSSPQCLLLRLPTEVFMHIFNYLDRSDLFRLLTVCREFADLIVEILWFRPNMQTDASFKLIRNIMSAPSSLTHWDYRQYIKRLNLSFMTKLVDDNLLALFYDCPRLERLTLVNCTRVTQSPITRMLQNCSRLQSIDLLGVTAVHDDIIYSLARNCRRLQGLYAPTCGQVLEEAILILLQSCPMLKRVKFNNSDNITDETTKAMHQNCKSLVEIDLHNCPRITDKYLRVIFLELSQLREFRISNAPGITDLLLELIPSEPYLEKLRIIDITGCNAITDKLVEKLVVCAPRLRNVVVSKCFQITDASLRALSHLGRSLHYVHLGHCSHITDFGVAALVRACHRIQYIDLACCTQLTDWLLVELTNLPKLRRIGLVKCNMITDNGIVELVSRRGERDCLERVHLSYCTNLLVAPIYYLLKNCPKLTHLSLTGISLFLRRDITQFCREPPHDFNQLQRDSFCVFLGRGVNELRDHLAEKMEPHVHYPNEGYDPRRRLDARLGLGLVDAQQIIAPSSAEPTSPNPWLDRQQVNREIFRELHDGNMSPDEMRLHYQMIMARQSLQRLQQHMREQMRVYQQVRDQQEEDEQDEEDDAYTRQGNMPIQMRLEDRMRQPRAARDPRFSSFNPLFAPQMLQPPTFDAEDDDVEMAGLGDTA